ncbi:uncharacterized protein LOC117342642 [Pecten maximus]|uniref:uncharacterized protein LOC117342642 n=1 Tax=Pecten maximus TaxID=6579 RepID=UPI00145876DB|nr:uncharacterized protein LOC117342642 [Pecten maximus]
MGCTTKQTLRLAFHGSVLANILLVITLVGLFIVRQTLRNQDIPTTASPETRPEPLTDTAGQICIPCDLQETTDTLYEFILRPNDNSTLCCLPQDDNLQNTILELLHGQNRPIWNADGQFDLRWWRERNHAAHLYAYFNSKGVVWNTHAHKTSFVRNLKLTEDGQLMIPEFSGAGLYFVYSFFTFDFSDVADGSDLPVGNHTVYKTSSSIINGDRDLLWTAKVGGRHKSKRQTSFLCGVVNINKFDKMESEATTYVAGENVTPNHINRALCSNFFGMFKILDFGNA